MDRLESDIDSKDNLLQTEGHTKNLELQDSPIDEENKRAAEQSKLEEFLKFYSEGDRHNIATLNGIDIIDCGNIKNDYLAILESGVNAMNNRFGKEAISRAFLGIKIYIGDASAIGGGQALPRANAVILNGAYMGISVDKMEDIASGAGIYRKGDQSKFFGGDADASEIGFVHELGHILEYRAHGDMGVGFRNLNAEEAPTWYGQQAAHEDYAESWMFKVYGHPITPERELIINKDIAAIGLK